MKKIKFVGGILAVALAVMSMSACNFGQQARDGVLEPAVQLAFSGNFSVSDDIMVGVGDAVEVGTITPEQGSTLSMFVGDLASAFETDDRRTAAAIYAAVGTEFVMFAERGIAVQLANGVIGPAAAQLKRNRLSEFERAMVALSQFGE